MRPKYSKVYAIYECERVVGDQMKKNISENSWERNELEEVWPVE